jgi:hypothetical protein
MDGLRIKIWLRLPSLSAATDLLLSPPLEYASFTPPILHGVIREGRRPSQLTQNIELARAIDLCA